MIRKIWTAERNHPVRRSRDPPARFLARARSELIASLVRGGREMLRAADLTVANGCRLNHTGKPKIDIPANKPSTSRLLDGLGAEDLTAVLQAAKEQRFSANSVVVSQAAAAKHLFC